MPYDEIQEEDWEPMRNMAFELAQFVSSQHQEEGADIREAELKSAYLSHLEYLEIKYGPHPWLIDIRADECEEPTQRIAIRQGGLELVSDNEPELKGQFILDLARDYLEELGDKESAADWLQRFKEISGKIENKSLLSEWAELEAELRNPK